jgi:hypothetical protein
VLERLQLHGLDPPLLEVAAVRDLREEPRRLQEVLGVAIEERVEALLLGHEPLDDAIELHGRAVSA